MLEDPKLMVLPLPGYQKFKSQPVEHNALAIYSLLRAKLLTKKIWIQDGVPTKVNLTIAHDVDDATFISIELHEILNEK